MEKSKMFLVLGLGLGDEGKGTIIDFLTRKYQIPLIIKTGGPQQGHNVVEPSGRWHNFSQFGSGTFIPETETFISKEAIVDPAILLQEFYALRSKGEQNAIVRIAIDADATIVTSLERMISQMREISRGKKRFGSCGMGVGETVFDREKGLAITFRDTLDTRKLRRKLEILHATKIKEAKELLEKYQSEEMISIYQNFQKAISIETLFRIYRNFIRTTGIPIDTTKNYLPNVLANKTPLIFEGTQGALLDRVYGFYPYITKTRTTFHFAERILGTNLNDSSLLQNYEVEKVGVIRAFATRHGAGPFVTEDIRLADHFKDPYNVENKWQGKLRFGWLDILAIRYGILANEGIDYLALTNLDQLSGLKTVKFCTSYQYEGNLDILDPYFVWEKINTKRARIIAFKKPNPANILNNDLSQILFKCRPLEFKEITCWKEEITKINRLEELPGKARECLNFLQGKDGLNVPIKIVSVNPTWEGKIVTKNP